MCFLSYLGQNTHQLALTKPVQNGVCIHINEIKKIGSSAVAVASEPWVFYKEFFQRGILLIYRIIYEIAGVISSIIGRFSNNLVKK